ncbi:MAG: hypothetical protein K9M07_01600 [Simkaniaceae bacterium]|nr:hypothetical protein [Simkaniaceae bacterium]
MQARIRMFKAIAGEGALESIEAAQFEEGYAVEAMRDPEVDMGPERLEAFEYFIKEGIRGQFLVFEREVKKLLDLRTTFKQYIYRDERAEKALDEEIRALYHRIKHSLNELVDHDLIIATETDPNYSQFLSMLRMARGVLLSDNGGVALSPGFRMFLEWIDGMLVLDDEAAAASS